MQRETSLLTRRSAIKRLLVLFGGGLTASKLTLLSNSATALADDSAPLFLDEEQLTMLGRIVDLIIPETDTPGALGLGVHRFIDLLLAEWASTERQSRWREGLAEINDRAKAAGMAGFSAGSEAQQIELLKALDREAFAEGGNATFFAELKKVVVFAYYSTEVGATVELAYQATPGDYLPCETITDDTRDWYWNGYSYGL